VAILAPLVILTVLFGVYPKPLMDPTVASVNNLIAKYNNDVGKAGKQVANAAEAEVK
jgi:NADH-quinone oxidoreductase subunit M